MRPDLHNKAGVTHDRFVRTAVRTAEQVLWSGFWMACWGNGAGPPPLAKIHSPSYVRAPWRGTVRNNIALLTYMCGHPVFLLAGAASSCYEDTQGPA